MFFGVSSTPVTAITGSFSVILHVSVLLPSSVVAVIVYSPTGTSAVHSTRPLAFIVNPSVVGSTLNVTFLLVALDGSTSAAIFAPSALPASEFNVLGDTVTPVTLTALVLTDTVAFSDSLPSITCVTEKE